MNGPSTALEFVRQEALERKGSRLKLLARVTVESESIRLNTTDYVRCGSVWSECVKCHGVIEFRPLNLLHNYRDELVNLNRRPVVLRGRNVVWCA